MAETVSYLSDSRTFISRNRIFCSEFTEIRGNYTMTPNKTYITLTKTDRAILDSYKGMVQNLGEYLGDGYEIILHSLENLEHSVIQEVNGYYSGRSVGAPITDLALSMLSRIEQDNSNSAVCYGNRSKTGVPLRSATLPVLGEKGRIIGLICINFYMDIPLSSLLSKFFSPSAPTLQTSSEITENFAGNTDELIETVLSETRTAVWNDSSVTSQNKNKEIVEILYHKGIFNIKDSVIKVAQLLNISKNTVYLHIRNLKSKN